MGSRRVIVADQVEVTAQTPARAPAPTSEQDQTEAHWTEPLANAKGWIVADHVETALSAPVNCELPPIWQAHVEVPWH